MSHSANSRLKVTFAGCGNMGLPMATALADAGHTVQGHDMRVIAAPFSMVDAAEAASCDVLISAVRDSAQSHALLYDDAGVLMGDQLPKLVVICSTLAVADLLALKARSPVGVTWVDAPMSGAPVAAIERRLSFMLGGPEEALDQLTPLFAAMGDPAKTFRLGAFTAGMTVKLLNNTVAASNVVATRLVFERAQAAGIPLDQLRAVMAVSTGQNWFASQFETINFACEGYAAENTMGIIEKDVTAAMHDGTHAFGDALLAGLRALEPFEV